MVSRRVVVAGLCDARGVPVLTYDDTGNLDTHELNGLSLAVVGGLNVVSPVMWRCDVDAWRKVLQQGAGHPSNVADMMAMAESGEPAGDLGTRHWRPDRYFGCAVRELTDGQVMAYDAAQLAYRDKVPKAKEKQWPIQKSPAQNSR